MPVVLFIQYQRCCCLNLNKDGHWTELSVWLPFRIAVNAILLIRLLKASLHARSLCEANTMQAVQTPQKGIALESHTSAVWPLAMLGRSVESLWTPSQLQSGEQNRFQMCDSRCKRQRAPRQMAPYCFPYLHFCMFGVGGTDAKLCKLHEPVSHTWMWLMQIHVNMWKRMFHLYHSMYMWTVFFLFCCGHADNLSLLRRLFSINLLKIMLQVYTVAALKRSYVQRVSCFHCFPNDMRIKLFVSRCVRELHLIAWKKISVSKPMSHLGLRRYAKAPGEMKRGDCKSLKWDHLGWAFFPSRMG